MGLAEDVDGKGNGQDIPSWLEVSVTPHFSLLIAGSPYCRQVALL